MISKPAFWHVRLNEIEDTIQGVKKGTVAVVANSAGKHPVYAVSYGKKTGHISTTNLSGAAGAGRMEPYKKEKDQAQVVILIGGCHGAEMEATAGLLNFVRLMETGADYAGHSRSELFNLAQKYRVIVIPCLNPDGRHRSPDHLMGIDNPNEAVRINQGIWADGSSIGYPECKMYQPIDPGKVKHLGGYPNDDGYNLMHDATPGDIKTAEVTGLLKLIASETADLALHFHSHPTAPEILPANHGVFDLHRKRMVDYRRRLMEFFSSRGLDVKKVPPRDPAATWLCAPNLATMTTLASGALSPVYEQPNGSCGQKVTFESMLEHTLAVVELFLRCGLNERFSPRYELMYSVLNAENEMSTYLKDKWD